MTNHQSHTIEAVNKIKIALVGNPNSGKSTLFNVLTGLKQNTANFPGITVDKKTGTCTLGHLESKNPVYAEIIDLPGTYSLYPKSSEEKIAVDIITDPARKDHPDILICIAAASNLKRSLLLCTQLIDLKTPVVLALNMIDLAKAKNLTIKIQKLTKNLKLLSYAANYPYHGPNPQRGANLPNPPNLLVPCQFRPSSVPPSVNCNALN